MSVPVSTFSHTLGIPSVHESFRNMFFDVSLFKSPNPQPLSLNIRETRFADGIHCVVWMLQVCPALPHLLGKASPKPILLLKELSLTTTRSQHMWPLCYILDSSVFLKKFTYFTTPQGGDDMKIIPSIGLLRI